VWEDLPAEIRQQLEDWTEAGRARESKPAGAASLFNSPMEESLGEHERRVFARLRHDEPMQLDGLMEAMEDELGSAEIFTALFELELAGRVKSLPGKNYVRCF
jgi:DNA processing protein